MLHNTLTRVRNLRKDEGGFTLIELLIVIMILGVLAGIVVFSVRGINDHGEASSCKATVSTVNTAVEAYYAQNSKYPTGNGDLVPDFLHDNPAAGYITYGATDAVAPTVKLLSAC
ncbi:MULTISPECIES: type II secretion system protein [unclassified Nocardioides]|uniref:type II secretion system protein n=1 Tax=unclassified Nocardioides TaxID=2615069 RepID=UPI00361FC1AA